VIRLLIVDDSALMRRVLGEIFENEADFEVAFARSGEAAIAAVHEVRPDVITLDINMPGMDGLTCLDRIMVERPSPVVMVSSLTEAGAATTLRALELGAIDFAAKPAGAISLKVDELAEVLVEKVRAAAAAKVRKSHRLAERVRMRTADARPLPAPSSRPRPQPTPPPRDLPTPTGGAFERLVLVGCSTGGPQALDVFLQGLTAGFPWPVVIAQHMPAAFTGPLARRLNDLCALEVIEVTGPTALQPGMVYVAKGDADIVVSLRAGAPVVMPAPMSADYRWHPSVDRLVSSALDRLGAERLVGVLMTGMGSDGAASMARLHAEGGDTIAEAEDTAVVWGMPRELIKAGGAGAIEPLDRIAASLSELASAQ
jgi:two-component system, chemotaxis family, protein-glutamate methylesterase/glutaminase